MHPHRHWSRSLIAMVSTTLLWTAAHAQQAPAAQFYPILEITQKPLQLYQEPKLSAPITLVEVPNVPKGQLGDGWRVLSATPQFYEVQAGEHGTGFARRSFVSVLPGSGIRPYCGPIASLPKEPTATTAGMGARC